MARPGLLSAQNRSYVQLVRTLGAEGVIRIGGNTSDDASFSPEGKAISAPKGTVVNTEDLRELGSFLDATGWKLIWGLNLGSGDERQAAEEAEAVTRAVKDKLLAFEIGNEPDLFGGGTPHRAKGYAYDAYLKEYRRYKGAIRASLPNSAFAGPDVASATDWVTRFAVDEGRDLRLLTHHYYRECANPASSLDKLLYADPKLAPQLDKLRSAAGTSGVPYRICETNSFCGGGKPGVSDAFGSALWTLDFMHALAQAGCAGVNIETGVNQLGFISSYSPIGDDEHRHYRAKPDYYGMLAFAQGCRGERIAVECEAAGVNLTAYAVLDGEDRIALTIVNKDAARDAEVSVSWRKHTGAVRALRLTGPSLESQEGVMLGGAALDESGRWKAKVIESIASKGGGCEIRVPAGSAVICS